MKKLNPDFSEPGRLRKSWPWLALLLMLGFAGNYLEVDLFFSVSFLFGSIASLVALIWFGGYTATTLALLISTVTVYRWNHPYALVIFTAEIAFLAVLFNRAGINRRNLLTLDALFWIVAGAPLIVLFYGGAMNMPLNSVLLIILKQTINGIFNALIASFILLAFQLRKRPSAPTQNLVSLDQALFLLVTALIFLPILTLTILNGRNEISKLEASVESRLNLSATKTAGHLTYWFRRHLHTMQQVADQAHRRNLQPSQEMQSVLDLLRNSLPDFHTLSLVNSNGIAVAFSPPVNEHGESTIGLDFSDRPYHHQLLETKQPLISDTFVGRGGIFEPIQVLAVPVLDPEDDAMRGYALGALNLDHVSEFLRSYSPEPDLDLVVMDQTRRVIASTRPDQQILDPMPDLAVRPVALEDPHLLVLPPAGGAGMPSMQRWRNSSYALEQPVSESIPWVLLAQVPIAPHQDQLYWTYVQHLGVALLFAFLALGVASTISRRLSRSIHELAEVTTDLPAKLISQAPVQWPNSILREIDSLIINYKTMVRSLSHTFLQLSQRSSELTEANRELQREVHQRQRTEEALLAAQTELQSHTETLERHVQERTASLAESVQSLESFCYSIAHDLRAPLRTMQGMSTVLLEDYRTVLDPLGRDYCERIIAAASRMDQLIQDLLVYGRLSHSELPRGPVSIDELVDQIRHQLQECIQERDARIELEPPLGQVIAHPAVLEQALSNLLVNAIKFVPADRVPVVVLKTEQHNQSLRLWIEDNGIGIAPEHHARIFNVFERLHAQENYAGTGIGLAIVRKGVERLGGVVGLESAPNRGSRFWIELPGTKHGQPQQNSHSAESGPHRNA